jgi:hypothetical protein
MIEDEDMTPSPKQRRRRSQLGRELRREMSLKTGFEESVKIEENKITIREPKRRHRTRRKNNKTIERKLRDETKEETPNLLKERNLRIFEKEGKFLHPNQEKIVVHTVK